MISDSIYYEGAEKVYTRTGFFDAANQARTQNQLLTFAEYTAREDAKTTPNRPYAVKKAVSYTHLDVYKRQTQSFSLTGLSPCIAALPKAFS